MFPNCSFKLGVESSISVGEGFEPKELTSDQDSMSEIQPGIGEDSSNGPGR